MLAPGTEDPGPPRRSVECATCGARSGWTGRVWKCNAGHETTEKDFPMGWPRGKR